MSIASSHSPPKASQMNEALAGDAAQGSEGKEQGTHANSATDDRDAKGFATLAAHFALSGFQLHRLAGGNVLMTRWGLAREFNDLGAAARFLRSIGGHA